MCVLVIQSGPTLCNPTDCRSPGFSVHGTLPGKNTGVGCYPGDLLDPGIKSQSPGLQADSLQSEPPGKPFSLRLVRNVLAESNRISIQILKQKDFFFLNLAKEAMDTARFGSTFDLRCLGTTSSGVSLHLLALPSSERMSSGSFSKGGQQQ